MKKVLITYAVEGEFIDIALRGCEVRHVLTGIGKTKASMRLTHAICQDRPDLVLNVGSAGTLNHAVGDIFVCNRFIDRDFYTINLPGVEHEINFEQILSTKDIIGDWISLIDYVGTCNTGDSFVTEAESIHGDVVDMEAFAQATVCREFNLPFIAVKYVTDIIGQNSVKQWEDKLADARKALRIWFERRL